MRDAPIRAVIADDHPLFQDEVVRALAGADGVEGGRRARTGVSGAGERGHRLSTKEASRAETVAAVRDAAAGKDVLARSVGGRVGRRDPLTTVTEGLSLSPREREILTAIAEGTSTGQYSIATNIQSGYPTVDVSYDQW